MKMHQLMLTPEQYNKLGYPIDVANYVSSNRILVLMDEYTLLELMLKGAECLDKELDTISIHKREKKN